MGYIYIYTNTKSGMQYVGQTINLRRRDGEHRRNYTNTYFDKAYSKHLKDFNLEYFECDENLLNFMEQYCIFWFQSFKPSGYNLTLGGQETWICTEETKRKMSKKFSGKNNPFYGKHHTKESRKIMSEKSKNHTKECAERLLKWVRENGSAMRGKHHTEKTKEKIRQTIKKIEKFKSQEIMWTDIGIIFESAEEAEKQMNIKAKQIRKAASGERKSAHGYHFKYI